MNIIKTYLLLFVAAITGSFIFLFKLRGTKIENLKLKVDENISKLKIEKQKMNNIKIEDRVKFNDLKEDHKNKTKEVSIEKNIDNLKNNDIIEINL